MNEISQGTAPGSVALVCGIPETRYEYALLIKRTYDIDAKGRCSLADEQLPLEYSQVYGEAPSDPTHPFAPASLDWESDLIPFRDATDLVVQGSAFTYGGATETTVELHTPKWNRVIRVFGDRRCELSGGSVRFSEPKRFDEMPVSVLRAYGGYDEEGHRSQGPVQGDAFAAANPQFGTEFSTPFHYPRNQAGIGFHVGRDLGQLDGAAVPNLEFDFDPVTPERMLRPTPASWAGAPLPATFDFQDQGWFPRCSLAGYHPIEPDEEPIEVTRGWCPKNLLELGPLHKGEIHPQFYQASMPGLATDVFKPGTQIGVVHMFPSTRRMAISTPKEAPRATLLVGLKDKRKMTAQLAAVVVQPGQGPQEGRLVQLWSARCAADGPRTQEQLSEMKWQIDWRG